MAAARATVARTAATTVPTIGGHFGYDALKRVLDVGASIVGLVLGLPIMGLVALAIVLESGGPIFYRATRVGQHGRPIEVLKFRTMRRDSDEILRRLLEDPVIAAEFHATFKLRVDPRCTRMGRFMRRTSLDELPQLWNVIRGTMSLVGPRPIVTDELEKYRAVPGGEAAYLAVKPGVTGLWQVSGRSDTTYEERVQLDIEYVRDRGLLRDLDVMIRTPKAALRGHGAY